MTLLLGASGYINKAFQRECLRRRLPFATPIRSCPDYASVNALLDLLRLHKPDFLINAVGYTGNPNVDVCELHKADCMFGNVVFPGYVRDACTEAGVPWGHVSSGCIYTGCRPDGSGFSEDDPPNFSFRSNNCSFYSGTKALGEEVLADAPQCYIWRPRIPFDELDNARNYLSKLQRYPKVYDNTNSMSHLGDFARACIDLWELRAPFGIYNMTNPDHVTARQVVGMIVKMLNPPRSFEFWNDDEEFYRVAAKTPRSNCVLDVSKLLATGVRMRPVKEALEDALRNWRPEGS